MKSILPLLILFLSLKMLQAQDQSYLSIELDGGLENEINYPPGTDFHLFNGDGDLVASDGDLEVPYKIVTRHMLIVSPSYKTDTDRYVISSGRILMKTHSRTKNDGDTMEGRKSNLSGNSVSLLRKEFLEPGNKGEQNILLVFDNDLVFRYFNGEVRAWYDGNEVPIQGMYLIDTPQGTMKISYEPIQGELWWVFEEKSN
ncbi:hypothetical protein FK220_001555 [Flavobacteriaceae bacterium TP-CH-4]|uniref:Lipopolysaccharide export system protein LptC n=1 Tax=Pelagihabitans pacificus TaxID=2696054 RepID=A0A967E441_9FLAO|nr:hypothetical protein [Pelagihabitans pacificus]NHF58007.1 hypothetical protein [Pelagihabitans pacificus]